MGTNFSKYFLFGLIIIGSMSCGTVKKMEGTKVRELPIAEVRDELDRRRIAVEHFRKAENYFKDGDLTKAEDEIKTALSLDPGHPVPHLLMGDIYFAKRDFQNAMREYRRAQAIDETKGLPYAKIGRVYLELDTKEKALEAFQAAVKLDPDVPGLHKELGDLYRRMGLEAEARIEYSRAERLLESGSVYASKENISSVKKGQGVEHLDQAIQKIVELGDEFLKDGLLSLAIEEYMIAMRRAPNSVIAHQKLGDAYVRKGMLEEAVGQYERVKELKPDSPLGYLGLGIVHSKMFDIEKAISSFEKGMSLAPDFPPLHFELAMAYFKADQLDEAISELEKTLALDPAKPKPKEILDKIKQEKGAEEGFVTIKNKHFIFKYDPRQDKAFVNDTLRHLREAYQKLVTDMSYEPEERIVVKLYPDLKAFHMAASTPEWFSGGVASAKEYKILLATPKKEINIRKFSKVITHELTHVFTNLITYSNHPTWFHEGIALYEASQWDSEKEKILRLASDRKRLIRLKELERPFTKFKNPQRIELAYAESCSAVKYILDNFGRDKLLQILSEFSKGRNFEEVTGRVLGTSAKEFEKRWLDFIKEANR